MTPVVEELILRRTPVDRVVLLRAAVKDARIALGRQLPIDLELEIGVLVGRDEVLCRLALRERPVFDVPLRRHALRLVAAPTGERASVEEELPAGFLFGGRECIRRGGGCLPRLLLSGEGDREGEGDESCQASRHQRVVKGAPNLCTAMGRGK